jgi:hypothetical protein
VNLIRHTVSTLAIALLVACSTDRVRSPNPLPAPDSDRCEPMCNYLLQLGCDEGKPLYDSDKPGPVGVPNEQCPEWCVKQQANGVFLNPRCIMKAPSCLAVEAYRARRDDCSK